MTKNRDHILQKILNSIKSGRASELDSYLQVYFQDLLEEYNFNFVHNKVYSRVTDKTYDDDCKTIHLLTIGFNYYLKRVLPRATRALPEQLSDSTNSMLLSRVSNPHLVNDILKYLHCYIFGLELPAAERCVNAREYLKFEDMVKKYEMSVKA